MTDKRVREFIEEMVRQEIRDVVAKHRATIEETVASLLIPELKMAIRDSVHSALATVTQKPPAETVALQPLEKEAAIAGIIGGNSSTPSAPSVNGHLSTLGHLPSAFGRYLYCIADSSEGGSLGEIGIQENDVYAISFRDLSAVVHNCPAEPYASEKPEIVKEWVMAHQKVVDAAWKRFSTVIPIGFDTIIQGEVDADPEASTKKWLRDDYENLMRKMEKIRGKAEYGVQIFWDRRVAAEKATEESPEIKQLTDDIPSKPRGLAYMYRQKLEGLLRNEVERHVDRYFREFYEKIAAHVDDVRVEKTKKAEDPGQHMLLNLSCLLPREGSQKLGDELEKIDALNGFSVRYSGPWPPYSFV